MLAGIIIALLLVNLFCQPLLAKSTTHVVTPGETLSEIALKYNLSEKELKEKNNLPQDLIYSGQKLDLGSFTYTVKKEDGLSQIAQVFNLSVKFIKEHNNLEEKYLCAGQTLFIGKKYVISEDELDLLSRIINAEADSESYETKVAVGAVILNRVESDLFPNNIGEVVYHIDDSGRYQFEPVLNGFIKTKASEESKKAAIDALNGCDPSNGALYFFESGITNSFLNERPVSKIIDSFTFSF